LVNTSRDPVLFTLASVSDSSTFKNESESLRDKLLRLEMEYRGIGPITPANRKRKTSSTHNPPTTTAPVDTVTLNSKAANAPHLHQQTTRTLSGTAAAARCAESTFWMPSLSTRFLVSGVRKARRNKQPRHGSGPQMIGFTGRPEAFHD